MDEKKLQEIKSKKGIIGTLERMVARKHFSEVLMTMGAIFMLLAFMLYGLSL